MVRKKCRCRVMQNASMGASGATIEDAPVRENDVLYSSNPAARSSPRFSVTEGIIDANPCDFAEEIVRVRLGFASRTGSRKIARHRALACGAAAVAGRGVPAVQSALRGENHIVKFSASTCRACFQNFRRKGAGSSRSASARPSPLPPLRVTLGRDAAYFAVAAQRGLEVRRWENPQCCRVMSRYLASLVLNIPGVPRHPASSR